VRELFNYPGLTTGDNVGYFQQMRSFLSDLFLVHGNAGDTRKIFELRMMQHNVQLTER